MLPHTSKFHSGNFLPNQTTHLDASRRNHWSRCMVGANVYPT